ncbi:MAG: hypothetical protein ACM3W7_12985 [Acidobacteriota bacterium]
MTGLTFARWTFRLAAIYGLIVLPAVLVLGVLFAAAFVLTRPPQA